MAPCLSKLPVPLIESSSEKGFTVGGKEVQKSFFLTRNFLYLVDRIVLLS